MAITVSDAKTQLEYRKKDLSDVSDNTFIQWCNFLNHRLYRMIYNIDPERYISTQDYSVVSGTSSYALPADFLTLIPYGASLFKVEDDGTLTDTVRARTRYGSSNIGFYINGSNIILTPEPTASETLKLRYIPTLDDIDELTDSFVIPDQFIEHLIDGLDVYYTIWDEDLNMEVTADSRYIRTMEEFVKHLRKEMHSIYTEDFSQIY